MPDRHAEIGLLPTLLAACLLGTLLVMAARTGVYWRRRARLLAVTKKVTRAHVKLLSVKQKQLVRHDGYGNYDLTAWIAHANAFIDGVILREAKALRIGIDGTAMGETLRRDITRRFLAVVNQAAENVDVEPDVERASQSGHRYEAQCQSLLQRAGWAVSATPQTGDQGADLIADADGKRVVIQCKFHAKPVGNKAVQEAYTARNMHGAAYAVVVSNNSFTRSAVVLARANDVLLMHHNQLPDLGRQIATGQTKPPGNVFEAGRIT